MPDIGANYAGPSLRWGLFLEDHPGATATFEIANADAVGIPSTFHDEHFSGEVVIATIVTADGERVATGWKEIPSHTYSARGNRWTEFKRSPEEWEKLTTMALGRALKKAGYPGDTEDLRGLIVWRKRNLELLVMQQGRALPAAPAEEFTAAARPDPDSPEPEVIDVAGEEVEGVSAGAKSGVSTADSALQDRCAALPPDLREHVDHFFQKRDMRWPLSDRDRRALDVFVTQQEERAKPEEPKSAPEAHVDADRFFELVNWLRALDGDAFDLVGQRLAAEGFSIDDLVTSDNPALMSYGAAEIIQQALQSLDGASA